MYVESPPAARHRHPHRVGRAAIAALLLAGCGSLPDPAVIRARTAALYGTDPDDVGQHTDRAVEPKPGAIRAGADLDRFQRYGLLHNGGLRQAFERWRAAVQRIPQATTLPNPMLSFTQFVEEVQTRTGPQERRYGISQSFPWPGTLRLRGAVATAAAEQAWQQVVARRLAVQRDIAVAFHEYGYLAHSIRIQSQVLDLLKQLEPVVQRQIRGGAGQQDLLRLQVEIGKVENEVRSLTELRPAFSARLAAAMNWTEPDPLPLPELAEPTPTALDSDRLWQRALVDNPQLQALTLAVEKHRLGVDLAGLDRWPDITVGFDYLETGSAANPATPGSGDDPYGVRIGLTLPIWGRRNDAVEHAARHELDGAAAEVRQFRADLRADLEFAAFKLADAGRQVVLYRESLLPRSRDLLSVTRASYRAGTASLLEMLDSERSLLEFETAYWRAIRDYLQSEARLANLIGGPVR